MERETRRKIGQADPLVGAEIKRDCLKKRILFSHKTLLAYNTGPAQEVELEKRVISNIHLIMLKRKSLEKLTAAKEIMTKLKMKVLVHERHCVMK